MPCEFLLDNAIHTEGLVLTVRIKLGSSNVEMPDTTAVDLGPPPEGSGDSSSGENPVQALQASEVTTFYCQICRMSQTCVVFLLRASLALVPCSDFRRTSSWRTLILWQTDPHRNTASNSSLLCCLYSLWTKPLLQLEMLRIPWAWSSFWPEAQPTK